MSDGVDGCGSEFPKAIVEPGQCAGIGGSDDGHESIGCGGQGTAVRCPHREVCAPVQPVACSRRAFANEGREVAAVRGGTLDLLWLRWRRWAR